MDENAKGIFVLVRDIPSIDTQRLTQFPRVYGGSDDLIKAQLLDVWSSSSKMDRLEDKTHFEDFWVARDGIGPK